MNQDKLSDNQGTELAVLSEKEGAPKETQFEYQLGTLHRQIETLVNTKEKGKIKKDSLPYSSLFKYATTGEKVQAIFGHFFAILTGLVMPITWILYGAIFDQFGNGPR